MDILGNQASLKSKLCYRVLSNIKGGEDSGILAKFPPALVSSSFALLKGKLEALVECIYREYEPLVLSRASPGVLRGLTRIVNSFSAIGKMQILGEEPSAFPPRKTARSFLSHYLQILWNTLAHHKMAKEEELKSKNVPDFLLGRDAGSSETNWRAFGRAPTREIPNW
jgi:hypothetical protein